MPANIVTTEDLFEFKEELLEELKKLFNSRNNLKNKKWLKSKEVRAQLSISPGTLQQLRISGQLPYSKIGGILFYQSKDIQALIEKNCIDSEV